ncbi:hypothetical protein, partial [Escherichia coli]|uniref:hypothetical protein n=1 Tax=Escherichia coli TaxID=562 RepID=UPI0025416D4B
MEKTQNIILEITNRQLAHYRTFVDSLKTLILQYLSSASLIDERKETADAGKDDKSNASKANNNGKSQQKTDEKKNDANAAATNSSTTN